MSDSESPSGWPGGWFGRLLSRPEHNPAETQNTASRKRMISAAENFHRLRVEDVMVPRADIIAVAMSTGLHDLTSAFKSAGHSRLPVYEKTLDEPLGMVHIKDVMPYLMLDADGLTGRTYPSRQVIQHIRRPVLFVPPSMLAQDLLRRMQARRCHMAIVVDEYGGTDGIVTLEDLIEPIVGDIDDEHDDADVQMHRVSVQGKNPVWEADARVGIDEFEKAIGRDFATLDEEDGVDTLGGLVFTLAGRVPERGEIIYHPDGLEFEVIDADPRRVKTLRIQSRGPAPVAAPSHTSTDEASAVESQAAE